MAQLFFGGDYMANTKYVDCPNCKQLKLGPYNVSTTSIQRTHGNCPKCGERYTVEYGNGKIKATKG